MRTFVTEPMVLAMFGELLHPPFPVCYLFPLSSVEELHQLTNEILSPDEEEQAAISSNLESLAAFFENPFVNKKIALSRHVPWAVSKPIKYSEEVTFQVVNSVDTAAYGEEFDPIETELLLLAMKENVPLLIEDSSIQERIIESALPVQVFDVSDFEFALEQEAYTDKQISPAIVFGGLLLILAVTLLISIFR